MSLLCKRSSVAAGADRAACPNLSYELMPTVDLWPLFSASRRGIGLKDLVLCGTRTGSSEEGSSIAKY